MLEGPTRFILEMLRSEPVVGAPGLNWSYSMYIGVILFVVGALMWLAMGWWDKRHPSERLPAPPSVPAPAPATA